jgi:hypothetical protein
MGGFAIGICKSFFQVSMFFAHEIKVLAVKVYEIDLFPQLNDLAVRFLAHGRTRNLTFVHSGWLMLPLARQQ